MDTSFDPTLAADIKQLLTEVPPPVRDFFASGKVEIVAKNLMMKNQLRVDQAAVVEREIILLLLGLKNPTEFTQTLIAEAKLSPATINSISQDVNDQIFKPIREQLRRQTGSEPRPQASGMRAGAPAAAVAPQPTGIMAPPPQSPKYFHLENKIPAYSTQASPAVLQHPQQPPPLTSRNAPLPPKNILPRPSITSPAPTKAEGHSPLRDALAAAMKTPTPKYSENMSKPKLLEDHEEPHIDIKENVAPQARLIPPPPFPTRQAPPAPKPYSSDPYREPIEP
ncbi:MAG: hypothetical protein NUV60_01275 [Patescibacteria group bacterium]|nr:hypothetical protein [Patescibacteria group bacterium]